MSPGDRLWYHFNSLVEEGKVLTDFGCGSANAINHYLEKNLKIQLIDIASNCLSPKATLCMQLFPEKIQFFEASLWELPETLNPYDYFACMDVMEHIPPEYVEESLKNMAEKHRGLGFFSICLVKDKWGDAINEPLHLSLFSSKEWLQKLQKYWSIVASKLEFNNQYLLAVVQAG